MFHHLTAHALPGQRPLASAHHAWWLWRRLRDGWPEALAACLMPTHVHLVLDTEHPGAEAARLGHLLAGFTRHVVGHRLWMPVSEPILLRDRRKLEVHIGYVHLNPCEPGLVSDPVCWPWSTHRESLGAVADPWVSPERLAAATHRSARTLSRRIRDLVTNSPRVSSDARKPVVGAPLRPVPTMALGQIVRAGAAATPWGPRSRRRHAVVLLADAQGWNDTAQLSDVTGLTRRSVQMLRRRKDAGLLAPALLCLGDERLRSADRDIAPLGGRAPILQRTPSA